jgi:hypothetical protein
VDVASNPPNMAQSPITQSGFNFGSILEQAFPFFLLLSTRTKWTSCRGSKGQTFLQLFPFPFFQTGRFVNKAKTPD